MKYWWVNQKQTYRHEVPGGYMWSPKLNAREQHIRPYDLMRVVVPGDIVFSYAYAEIKAVGVVQSPCYEFPKPSEFGAAGDNWSNIGWRVDVNFKELIEPVRTMDHIAALRKLLPQKHSPIKSANGGANESYLFDISEDFALALAHLLEHWVVDLVRGNIALESLPDRSLENIIEWEDRIEKSLDKDPNIPVTEKAALIRSRRGQGTFRQLLMQYESKCRVTGVDKKRHLIASHTKPWRDCSNEERLDPENGFLLTPTIDHLFDRGFISFEDTGTLIISPVAHASSMEKMGVPLQNGFNVGFFSDGQKAYLNWHRESILLINSL